MSDSKFLLASQLAPIHFALQESENAPTPDRLAEIGTASRQFITFHSTVFCEKLKRSNRGERDKDAI